MKNSFVVKFAVFMFLKLVKVWAPVLAPFITFFSPIITYFLERFLGALADNGILTLDLTLDARKIALEEKEFERDAKLIYDKAMARVYTEEEKRAIRAEYLRILAKFGRVNGAHP